MPILVGIEVAIRVGPARREPDPVQERGVHRKAAVVVLELCLESHPPRTEPILQLRGQTGGSPLVLRPLGVGSQDEGGETIGPFEVQAQVRAAGEVRPSCQLGNRGKRPGVAAAVQTDLRPRDLEQLLSAEQRVLPVRRPARRLIHGGQRTERHPPGRTGHLRPDDRIDDAPGVDGVEHGRVTLHIPRKVEEPCSLHEEGTLLREEDGEPLVDLHLEGVAFHLAEIRVGGGLERHRGGQPPFRAEAYIRVAAP